MGLHCFVNPVTLQDDVVNINEVFRDLGESLEHDGYMGYTGSMTTVATLQRNYSFFLTT